MKGDFPMKRVLQLLTLTLCCLIVLCMLVACAASAPLDGEIGSNPAFDKNGSLLDGWFGGSLKDEAESLAPSAPMESPGGADMSYGEAADGEWGGSVSNDSFQHQAGQLTGAQWKDNDHFAEFAEKINGQGNSWYDIAAKWNQVATKRIYVRVHNGSELPIHLARVTLLDAKGNTIYAAVTDADGNAYLFYNLNRTLAGDAPASIRVVAQDGKTLTHTLEEGATDVTLALEAENAPLKLDVMFMIDTTGSMGDELEYLKAEMGDVIRRASGEDNISVRTSVNFYRDKGDEYELRYFDFREDVDEAVSLLAKQSAAGGGDYEEAVDTALDFAINQARWDENAVKIMFLVLDAPPHYDAKTVSSINASIQKAAEMGIRIIPVASSGVDTTCQVLFRTWAAMTGGTYTYLTDHSGIGGSHQKPDVESEEVMPLNDLMVSIIQEYLYGSQSESNPDAKQ
jgi:hypothetical protein